MNKSLRVLSLLSIVCMTILFMNAIHKSDIDSITSTHKTYKIKALKLPSNLNLAGERVPIEKPDVKERMDRELLVNTYWQSNGLLLLKRANKYFPILEPLLRKYGLPDDFKFLALAESGFSDETSSAGAAGIWHFMKATGREYGLEINKNVDERYNIEKSTKVAAEYLKNAKDRFGSWTLAAAAYNAGKYGIARRLETQKVSTYYDAKLANETERYVFRILALKEIIKNPEKYGFVFEKEDLYTIKKTYTIKVDTAINNIASFAKGFNINYKELKIHNPWLRENKLNNKSRKVYEIKIPIK
ncbi:MAG: lytic transglycosylase domain-containing protein [Polaribacter sp.]|jgi:membrane-bound lytic murein transglycosylase D|nr:lytic transglycosylase domain-containing protein [Polaribacter sp.]MBT4414188.1 lytic transglycosylase domain-containing protein [Polaribacter sp.]MBT7816857.1 lytic transglycosylase domain-containing protein [Polaribacter sp.]MDG1194151.1 lytic transglycosylase domain-containing protein [Polaribacter sp.]MDG2435934.1 lytic transglycosylase domain-containing protein [Polaribacter sp.]